MKMKFESGPSSPPTPEEKLADAEKRLATHLEVAGSDEERNEITKKFYLNELGYQIETKGLLHGKVRLLESSGGDKKEYVTDPETGKPKEFKTHFKLPKGETPLIGFLKEELKERLGMETSRSKARRFQERLDTLWEGKKGPRDIKRLREINEKIEQTNNPWVAWVMSEIKKLNINNKEFRLLKIFKPEDVDRLKQMSQDKGWDLSNDGIVAAQARELAVDFMKEADPLFKDRLHLLSGGGKIKFESKEIYHLYDIHKKAEAAKVPWVFGLLKEMMIQGRKDEVVSFKPEKIDELKRIIKRHSDMKPKKGLTKKKFETLITELG